MSDYFKQAVQDSRPSAMRKLKNDALHKKQERTEPQSSPALQPIGYSAAFMNYDSLHPVSIESSCTGLSSTQAFRGNDQLRLKSSLNRKQGLEQTNPFRLGNTSDCRKIMYCHLPMYLPGQNPSPHFKEASGYDPAPPIAFQRSCYFDLSAVQGTFPLEPSSLTGFPGNLLDSWDEISEFTPVDEDTEDPLPALEGP